MKTELKKIGRPKNNEGTNKQKPSWTIPPDLIAELDAASDATGASKSQLVTMCCKQRLGSLVKILLATDESISNSTAMISLMDSPSQPKTKEAK